MRPLQMLSGTKAHGPKFYDFHKNIMCTVSVEFSGWLTTDYPIRFSVNYTVLWLQSETLKGYRDL